MSELFAVLGQARASAKGARRVRQGHPWIYKSDLEALPSQDAGLVEVVDDGGRRLGLALLSPRSTITLRMVARGNDPFDRSTLRERVRAAVERRERSMRGADAFRVVHGEADLLPGVFVDRYGDCLSVQTTCAGADHFEALIVEDLVALLAPRAVVLRDDVGSRGREGLRQHVTVAQGAAPVVARYHEGEIAYEVDLLADMKTGSFLDQSANHVRAGAFARGRGLDCFTYHGGFALQLARGGCEQVLACDQSEAAAEKVRQNAARAGLVNVEALRADVFELLPELIKQGRRFDTMVLDPPAFASTQGTVENALRAYKEINLRAMRLLTPNGVLVSCSCSGRVTGEAFDEVLHAAARDARRSLQILERRGAGPDHPALAGVPETEYLKCRVCLVI